MVAIKKQKSTSQQRHKECLVGLNPPFVYIYIYIYIYIFFLKKKIADIRLKKLNQNQLKLQKGGVKEHPPSTFHTDH